MKIGWSIEHEQVNPCTKFGINQIKTEGSTGDQSEGDINPPNIFLSLRGCEKKIEKENKFLCYNGGYEVWIRECQYTRFRPGN